MREEGIYCADISINRHMQFDSAARISGQWNLLKIKKEI